MKKPQRRKKSKIFEIFRKVREKLKPYEGKIEFFQVFMCCA
jgi:hypothetical protein